MLHACTAWQLFSVLYTLFSLEKIAEIYLYIEGGIPLKNCNFAS